MSRGVVLLFAVTACTMEPVVDSASQATVIDGGVDLSPLDPIFDQFDAMPLPEVPSDPLEEYFDELEYQDWLDSIMDGTSPIEPVPSEEIPGATPPWFDPIETLPSPPWWHNLPPIPPEYFEDSLFSDAGPLPVV